MSVSQKNYKRKGRYNIPKVNQMQQLLAASMSKTIRRMTNSQLQEQCMKLLNTEDINEIEMRILFVLKEIDKDLETEKESEVKKHIKLRK